MIEVDGLSYSYNGIDKIEFPDFAVGGNDHCLLLGESGSGKTTLLHLLGGLLPVQHGSVTVNSIALSSLSETARDHFRGKSVGFIFQENHLMKALTVKNNLLMAPFLAGIKQHEKQVDDVLDFLGLTSKKNSRVHELSQGQVQRVAVARALMNKPAVILADEPTSALDDTSCERVIRLLRDVTTQYNTTLVIATHDQRLRGEIKTHVHLAAIR
jgi:putative ABC transport system ATP-binding protein